MVKSSTLLIRVALSACTLAAAGLVAAPAARGDVVAYLLNVTVRPGYDFAGPDGALTYGYAICDKIASGDPYPQLLADIKADFTNPDEYQASYLASQAVNELCPALIWQLRNSAANYHPVLSPESEWQS